MSWNVGRKPVGCLQLTDLLVTHMSLFFLESYSSFRSTIYKRFDLFSVNEQKLYE